MRSFEEESDDEDADADSVKLDNWEARDAESYLYGDVSGVSEAQQAEWRDQDRFNLNEKYLAGFEGAGLLVTSKAIHAIASTYLYRTYQFRLTAISSQGSSINPTICSSTSDTSRSKTATASAISTFPRSASPLAKPSVSEPSPLARTSLSAS